MITSADEFVRLRLSVEKSDYDRTVYEDAPVDVWEAIVRDYPEMHVWVAHNRTVPDEVLKLIAGSCDPLVRLAVAMKRRCPPELLAGFLSDNDHRVRMAVVRNPRVPLDVLHAAATNDDLVVAREAGLRLATRGG